MDRLQRWLRMRSVQAGLVATLAISVGAGSWYALSGAPAPTSSIESTPSPASTATPTNSPSPTSEPTATPSPVITAVCPLSGLPLTDGEEISPVAFAVQVENHPQARPTRNLGQADMVIEATVEGDVTRFTPIFLCQPTIGLTGPVRSARYYTLDLNQSLHVLPYFFGAEHEAIRRFSAANMPYVNGIFGTWPGSWFLRSGTNPAPHNLYTNLEAARSAIGNYAPLDALVDSVGPPRPPFNFDPAAVLPADGRAVAGLEVRTNAYWRIGWTWDASSSSWLRSDAGVANVDEATGTQLRASTVVVQKVVETVDNTHHDPAGNPRRVHQLVGSGTGIVYSGGRAFDVRWSRADAQAGTTWTYASTGQPVILPPGVVWWEIVPTYSTFTED